MPKPKTAEIRAKEERAIAAGVERALAAWRALRRAVLLGTPAEGDANKSVDGYAQRKLEEQQWRTSEKVAYTNELIGTAAIVAVGCSASAVGIIAPSMAFGLMVALCISCAPRGAPKHYNPAVTFAFACAGITPWKSVVPYVLCQFIGAMVGATVAYGIAAFTAAPTAGACVSAALSFRAMFATEALLTATLVNAIFTLEATVSRFLGAVPFALCVGAAVTAICSSPWANLSGGGLNPARAIAPPVVARVFRTSPLDQGKDGALRQAEAHASSQDAVAYAFAPLVGSGIAAALWAGAIGVPNPSTAHRNQARKKQESK